MDYLVQTPITKLLEPIELEMVIDELECAIEDEKEWYQNMEPFTIMGQTIEEYREESKAKIKFMLDMLSEYKQKSLIYKN